MAKTTPNQGRRSRGFSPSDDALPVLRATLPGQSGLVRGPGTGTSDDVPDEVPAGTFIMPADSTAKIGPKNLAALGLNPDAKKEKPEEPGESAEGETAAQEKTEEDGEAQGIPDDGEVNDQEGNGPGQKVPVQLSNGEFKMPPEQIYALGVAVLRQMKDATHAQVRGFNPSQEADEPQSFFANGGVVTGKAGKRLCLADGDLATKDRLEKSGAANTAKATISPSNIYPQGRPDAGAGIYDGLGTELGSSGKFAQVPQGVIGQQPPKPTAPPPVATRGFPTGSAPTKDAQPPGLSYADNNQTVGQGIKDSWNKGNYGEAVGKTVAGTVGMFTTPVIDGAVRGGGAAWDGAKGFGRGIFGMNDGASNPPTIDPANNTKPLDQSAPKPSNSALAAQAEAQAWGDQTKPPTPATSTTQAASMAASPSGVEIDKGVYKHGNGQYSDSAQGMGFNTNFTGQPSAQNSSIYDGMAARSAANSVASAQAPQAVGFQPSGPASTPHSGNSWSAANALRNLEVSASSITNQPGRWSSFGGKNGQSPAAQAYSEAVKADIALRTGNDPVALGFQREQGSIQREGIQQQGATARTQMQEAGATQRDAGRNAIQQGELGLKREAQGFQSRLATQQEQLRNTLIDPNATPEQRRIAQRNLSAMSGKTAADRMQVVKLPDSETSTGQKKDGGQAVIRTLEDGNVEQVPIGGQTSSVSLMPSDPAQRKVGSIYTLADGRRVQWDGKGAKPVQ